MEQPDVCTPTMMAERHTICWGLDQYVLEFKHRGSHTGGSTTESCFDSKLHYAWIYISVNHQLINGISNSVAVIKKICPGKSNLRDGGSTLAHSCWCCPPWWGRMVAGVWDSWSCYMHHQEANSKDAAAHFSVSLLRNPRPQPVLSPVGFSVLWSWQSMFTITLGLC